MNGMNGGGMNAGMVAPMPAGHQADLNYIYGLVDDLSRQLAENKKILEEVVSGVGKVRARARQANMSNEELIAEADDLNPQNLDVLISVLSEALEKAKYSRDENMKLLQQFASALAAMLQQFHEYKAKHVADVSAWHRSYRQQLAEARAENSQLREQIWDMQAHAGKANATLRTFRGRFDADPARWERRVDAKAVRQELRFWKRMAMPEVADDDPDFWSDDDDLIDPAEKVRLRELAREQAAAALAAQQMQDQEDQQALHHNGEHDERGRQDRLDRDDGDDEGEGEGDDDVDEAERLDLEQQLRLLDDEQAAASSDSGGGSSGDDEDVSAVRDGLENLRVESDDGPPSSSSSSPPLPQQAESQDPSSPQDQSSPQSQQRRQQRQNLGGVAMQREDSIH